MVAETNGTLSEAKSFRVFAFFRVFVSAVLVERD